MAGRPFKNCRRAPAAAEILAFRLKARDHSRDPLPCQVVLPAAFFCGATNRYETTIPASLRLTIAIKSRAWRTRRAWLDHPVGIRTVTPPGPWRRAICG